MKIIESKQIYKGAKVALDRVKVKLATGNVVEWDRVMFPDIVYGIPLTAQGTVLMVEEWRAGPEKPVIQFSGARMTSKDGIKDVARELEEEIGLKGGKYTKLADGIMNGVHINGFKTLYLITDFTIGANHPDKDELIRTVELPLEGLFARLLKEHTATMEAMIGAILAEEYVRKSRK